MAIRYLNHKRIFYLFFIGSRGIFEHKDLLNEMNVFPIRDGDTGTNMASTLLAIIHESQLSNQPVDTYASISDAALYGARGNSGMILAQFIFCIFEEIKQDSKISPNGLAKHLRTAMQKLYLSIDNPVEGTMLTVMRRWADSFPKQTHDDFLPIFQRSIDVAEKAVLKTKEELLILKKADVVDAGALGFLFFLKAIAAFLQSGNLRTLVTQNREIAAALHHDKMDHRLKIDANPIEHQFCTEAILTNISLSLYELKKILQNFGDSIVFAGTKDKIRFHVHTNRPADLFSALHDQATVLSIKVDDMVAQQKIVYFRKYPIALVTDTACDLPEEYISAYQIQKIPFYILFGQTQYLDKVTITPSRFYELLQTSKEFPKSAQPGIKAVQSLYSFLGTYFHDIISIHISSQLSGSYQIATQVANTLPDHNIFTVDSKNLSVSQGLLVLRIAQAIANGDSMEMLQKKIPEWIEKVKVFVDINTLKYMVKGGRISPMKGWIAKLLHLKPIVSLDQNGKAVIYAKSFSRTQNMQKIVGILEEIASRAQMWKYAIVHVEAFTRAQEYAQRLEKSLGQPASYIIDVAPVIGVHNGIGACAVAIMME